MCFLANPNPLGDQHRNRQPHVGGVGDLGTRSDKDVVRLPDERGEFVTGEVLGLLLTRTLSAAATTSSEDPSANQEAQRAGKKSNWEHRTIGDITHPAHSGGTSGTNHDNDHGLGGPHREGEHHSGRDERAIRGRQGDDNSHQHDQHSEDDHDEDNATSPKMKDKIKGSLLIAKGKITRDKEDVAQGKLLKTTGQTEPPTSAT